MRPEGVELTYAQFLASFGQKKRSHHAGLARCWTWTSAHGPAIGEDKEAEYRRLAETHGLTPLPGAREWLETLKAAGWKQAIASSAPVRQRHDDASRRRARRPARRDRLGRGRDDREARSADIPHGGRARSASPPSRCIVVEDAAAGVEGARRAGMRSIGVTRNGRLDADLFVTSLADLPPDAFDRLLPSA